MKKALSLLLIIIITIATTTGCSSGNSAEYSNLLTAQKWRNSTVGSITFSQDGTWTSKSLYGGRSGHWSISGSTLTENNKDGKEWSYSFIEGISDEDVENAADISMMQDTWKGQWYVSEKYLILGEIIYTAVN